MKDLREVFLVDKLREAAAGNDELYLALIREIIRQIKLIQIRETKIADDEMIVEVLTSLVNDKGKELAWLNGFLNEALAQIN